MSFKHLHTRSQHRSEVSPKGCTGAEELIDHRDHTAIAAQSGSAGSTRIGARCMIGGHVGIADHIEIGDDIVVLGGTMVTGSLKKPGAYGGPAAGADDVKTWRRNAVRYRQLDELARRIKQLERAQGNDHAAD